MLVVMFVVLVEMFVVMLIVLLMSSCSIYIVHDEVKDKAFELDLSWVGEGKNWWIG